MAQGEQATFKPLYIRKSKQKSSSYHTVKNWFLGKFPEIAKFGLPSKEDESSSEQTADSGNKEHSNVVATLSPFAIGAAA